MFAALVALACSLQPLDLVVEEKVDLIEVNHFYDENAKLVFDQVIFYEWCDEACRFQVCAWRMLKRQSQWPSRGPGLGLVSRYLENGRLWKVHSSSFRETWTQYDPEMLERDFLPKERRREFWAR